MRTLRHPIHGFGQTQINPLLLKISPTVAREIAPSEGLPTWAYVAMGVAGVGLVWFLTKKK